MVTLTAESFIQYLIILEKWEYLSLNWDLNFVVTNTRTVPYTLAEVPTPPKSHHGVGLYLLIGKGFR